jgi:mannose-1-phosphate guanylyltransferase
MIPALVLTAGLATRLRPLSLVRAKAALPVAGQPLVRRILGQLADAGVDDVVLNLHHLPQTITAAVGDGSDLSLRVRYSWETPVLGSAGGPRRAIPLLRHTGSGTHSTFFIVNGDTLTNVDLRALAGAHRDTGALITMAVVPNVEPEKYGGALVDAHGVITSFVKRASTQPSWHVVGVQVAEAAAFATVPENVPYESVLKLYPALIAENPRAVRAFQCEAEFFDIGTAADYLDTSLRLAERESTSALRAAAATNAVTIGARTRIDANVRLERSILWDDVVVEAGASIRECVVTDGVRVPEGTSWHGVSLRRATGELVAGERRVDGLAVCAI